MALPVLAAYQAKVDLIVQDPEDNLLQAEVDSFIAEAISTYSQYRPVIKVFEYTGDGTAYEFSLPTDWEDGFSAIKEIESPVGAHPPTYLAESAYMLRQTDLAKSFVLSAIPANLADFLFAYSIRHSVTAGAGTISEADFEAVCNLAAGLVCLAIGRKLNQGDTGATITVADETWRTVIRYSEKGQELIALFAQHMAMGPITNPATPAAIVTPGASSDPYAAEEEARKVAKEGRLDAQEARLDATLAIAQADLVIRQADEARQAAEATRVGADQTVTDALIAALEDLLSGGPGDLQTLNTETYLQEAVTFYSRHRPQVATSVIAGDGTGIYDLPTNWIADFSIITELEYPYPSELGEEKLNIMSSEDYWLYSAEAGWELRMRTATPETTENFKLTYTIPHTLTAEATSIPDEDLDAVITLAGALACFALGRKILVAKGSFSKEKKSWFDKGNALKAVYDQHMNKFRGSPEAAFASVQQTAGPSWGGRFFHRRGY
jgi:hypothetical protein